MVFLFHGLRCICGARGIFHNCEEAALPPSITTAMDNHRYLLVIDPTILPVMAEFCYISDSLLFMIYIARVSPLYIDCWSIPNSYFGVLAPSVIVLGGESF